MGHEHTRINRDAVTRLCDDYLAAINDRDLDALMGLFTADARQEEPVGTPANIGRAQIREFFAARQGIPFGMRRLGPVTVVGNRAVFQALVHVDDADGRREFVTSDVLTIDADGRIAEILAFPDPQADPYEAQPPKRARAFRERTTVGTRANQAAGA